MAPSERLGWRQVLNVFESSALAGSEGSGIVCSTWHAVALAPGVTDFIVDFGKVWPGPTP